MPFNITKTTIVGVYVLAWTLPKITLKLSVVVATTVTGCCCTMLLLLLLSKYVATGRVVATTAAERQDCHLTLIICQQWKTLLLSELQLDK